MNAAIGNPAKMAAFTYLDTITQMTPGLPYSPILQQGDSLVSPSGTYSATQQTDGNFVVYRGTDPGTGSALWASNTTHGANSGITYAAYTTQYGNLANQAFLAGPGYTPYTQTLSSPDFFLSKMNGTFGTYFTSVSDTGILSVKPGSGGNATGNPSVQTAASDAVKSITLNTITYDLDHAVYNSQDTVYGATSTSHNGTSVTQTYPLTLALSYSTTQTFTWNMSEAIAASVSTTEKISVPGVAEVSVTEQLTSTTTLSAGQSTASGEVQTYTQGAQVVVPAFSTYSTTITGQKVDATIPYSFTGIAYYESGAEAPVYGLGSFNGVSTGAFYVDTECVDAPGGCPLPPVADVPEPAAALLLPVALVAVMAIRGLRPIAARRAPAPCAP